MTSGSYPVSLRAAVYPVCGRCLRELHACVCPKRSTWWAVVVVAVIASVVATLGLLAGSRLIRQGHADRMASAEGGGECRA